MRANIEIDLRSEILDLRLQIIIIVLCILKNGMTTTKFADYKILCDVGDDLIFNIAGKSTKVNFDELYNDEVVNAIYRFQFNKSPRSGQLEKVLKAISKRPDVELRFYGAYSENEIDWGQLITIENLQIDLWETIDLKSVSKLTNLKRLGITKNIKSKVSLEILTPLKNLEYLYTSVSKDIEVVRTLTDLKFLSLFEIKHKDLDFLSLLHNLKDLRLSLGSFTDFKALSKIENLEKLSIHQVRGFDRTEASVLEKCNNIWALKLDNLKHLEDLSFLGEMDSLKYLAIEGLKNIDTFSPLLKNKSLETIQGYQCRPTDKSLNGLKRIQNIFLGDTYSQTEIESFLKDSNSINLSLRGKTIRGVKNLKSPF